MIISEFKNRDGINYRPKRVLIRCDNCSLEYNRSILDQIKRFKLYNRDLCRSCGQIEQYNNGSRSKNQCSGLIKYNKSGKGKSFDQKYGKKKAETIRRKISKSSSGKNNPMYGKNYQCYGIIKYGKFQKGKTFEEIYGIEKSNLIKKEISKHFSGENNPMYGKPAPSGSGNGWSGWYKGWYFRSLHELSYMINVIERFKLKWKTAEKLDFKIFYKDFNGINKTYVADFIINKKYLVEIKPKALHKSKNIQLKKEAAEIFCKERGLIYKLLDSPILSKEKISELYKTHQIKFIKRYEQRVINYLQI